VTTRGALLSIGLCLPPLALAVSTGANYALAAQGCVRTNAVLLLIVAVCCVLSLGGGWICAQAAWGPRPGGSARFMGVVGALMSLLFLLAILLQGASGLMTQGCGA
jgi:hypothetical protein